MDFGEIKYQCSCSFTSALKAQLIYSLSKNPGDEFGTAIQIKEINCAMYRLPCQTSIHSPEFSSQSITVEVICNWPTIRYCENTGYCLRVFSIINGSCQSISPPSSSSETSITSTQSGLTNSTQSVTTHSTQRSVTKTTI